MPRNTVIGPAGAMEVEFLAHSAPRALAVICHPHPLHGGTMDNKVVTTLVRFFAEAGASTLRFNFRGVGGSAGVFDHGRGEGDDLEAVVAWARQQQAGHAQLPLWLAGFSFGSYVAASRAYALGAARLVSIAPPVERWDFAAVPRIAGPWIVVQGEVDEVVAADSVYRFVASSEPQPLLIRMPGATHFFHGLLIELRQQLAAVWSAL